MHHINTEAIKKTAIERVKWLAGVPYQRELDRLGTITEQEFWDIQRQRFLRIYADATRHVPYYRDQPDLYPPAPSNKCVLDTLASLPVLGKATVKNKTELFWREPALRFTAEHTTGGTTGTPMRVRASLRERGYTNAVLEQRYLDIVGTRHPRILRLSGFLDRQMAREQIFLKIPGTRFAYLSIYDLHPGRAQEIRRLMDEFKPDVLHGYASALHQLALLFKYDAPYERGAPLAVVSTSETLSPQQRRDIEQYLSASVFNEYGSQERQHLVLECKEGSLHIHPTIGIVELLKPEEDQPAAPGELGRVVVTGLGNRSMPLIRYEIGDTAVSSGYKSGCSCGCHWPTIGIIFGRTEDLVRTRDGKRIGLLSHSTLKDWDGIKESQIVQTDFEKFLYLIVPQNPDTFDHAGLERHVHSQLRNRVGGNPDVEFRYVTAVPRTSAGKIRAVVVDFDG